MVLTLNLKLMKTNGKMNSTAAARIQSATAKTGNGTVSKASFAARATAAAAKNSTKK
jgi:hypothetical protein